ncbi:hypothetical protein C1N61_26355 (plasmid) [Priestia aryabhattai]
MKEQHSNTVDITPSVRIFTVLRNTGFDIKAATAELLDNAVDANAREIDLYAYISDQGKKNLLVVDDGMGMSTDALKASLTLAELSKGGIDELGKYGMGLKTAALSLSRKFEIFTMTAKSGVVMYAEFDVDKMEEKNKFEAEIREATEDEANFFLSKLGRGKRSGTVIRIADCDRFDPSATTYANQMEIYIGKYFKNFIEKGLSFTVSDVPGKGKRIKPIDCLMRNDQETQIVADREEVKISYSDGGRDATTMVLITAAVMPKPFPRNEYDEIVARPKKRDEVPVTKANQGIYFFREQRLVAPARATLNLFGDKNGAKTRFRIEIHFKSELDNEINMDFHKGNVKPTSRLASQLSDAIRPYMRKMADIIDAEEMEETNKRAKARSSQIWDASPIKEWDEKEKIASAESVNEFLRTANSDEIFDALQKKHKPLTDSLKRDKPDLGEYSGKSLTELVSDLSSVDFSNKQTATVAPEVNYMDAVSYSAAVGKTLKSNSTPKEVKEAILENLGLGHLVKEILSK